MLQFYTGFLSLRSNCIPGADESYTTSTTTASATAATAVYVNWSADYSTTTASHVTA